MCVWGEGGSPSSSCPVWHCNSENVNLSHFPAGKRLEAQPLIWKFHRGWFRWVQPWRKLILNRWFLEESWHAFPRSEGSCVGGKKEILVCFFYFFKWVNPTRWCQTWSWCFTAASWSWAHSPRINSSWLIDKWGSCVGFREINSLHVFHLHLKGYVLQRNPVLT